MFWASLQNDISENPKTRMGIEVKLTKCHIFFTVGPIYTNDPSFKRALTPLSCGGTINDP